MSLQITTISTPYQNLCNSSQFSTQVFCGEQIMPYIPKIKELALDQTDRSEFQPFLEMETNPQNAIACLLFYNDQLIGANTGIPLKEMPERFCRPFESKLEKMFYLGQEVIDKSYRTQSLEEKLYSALEENIPPHFDTLCLCRLSESEETFNFPLIASGYSERKEHTFQGVWENHPMVYWTKSLKISP